MTDAYEELYERAIDEAAGGLPGTRGVGPGWEISTRRRSPGLDNQEPQPLRETGTRTAKIEPLPRRG